MIDHVEMLLQTAEEQAFRAALNSGKRARDGDVMPSVPDVHDAFFCDAAGCCAGYALARERAAEVSAEMSSALILAIAQNLSRAECLSCALDDCTTCEEYQATPEWGCCCGKIKSEDE